MQEAIDAPSGVGCILVVDFVPTTPGTSNTTLGVSYSDGQGGTPTIFRSLTDTATP